MDIIVLYEYTVLSFALKSSFNVTSQDNNGAYFLKMIFQIDWESLVAVVGGQLSFRLPDIKSFM